MTVGRDLDGAGRDPFGDHRGLAADQLRPCEADAHPVCPGVHRPLTIEGCIQAVTVKGGGLPPRYNPQSGRLPVIDPVGIRHLGVGGGINGGMLRKAQLVAGFQWQPPALVPTEPLTCYAGDTAKLGFPEPATGYGKVCPQARMGQLEGQSILLSQLESPPGRQALTIHRGAEVRATEGHRDAGAGDQRQPANRDLEYRCTGGIAQQGIGPAGGIPVHRTALGHAEMPNSETAGVLQQGLWAGFFNIEGARWGHSAASSTGVGSPPSSMKRSRLMGTNRTRSPASSMVMGSRVASKSVTGVRPIRFHPPGVTWG